MKLVIDISEEDYNFVKKQVADGITNPLKMRIANGTPLPKGHGRLIDADCLKNSIHNFFYGHYSADERDIQAYINAAKTRIEADKEQTL